MDVQMVTSQKKEDCQNKKNKKYEEQKNVINNFSKEISELSTAIMEFESSKQIDEAKIASLKRQQEITNREVAFASSEIHNLQKEVKATTLKFHETFNEDQSRKLQIGRLEVEVVSRQKEIDILQVAARNFEKHDTDQKVQVAELQAQIDEKECAYRNISEAHKSVKAMYNENIALLKSEKQNLLKENADSRGRIAKMNSKCECHENALQHIKTEYRKLIEEINIQKKENTANTLEFELKIARLERTVETTQNEKAVLAKELSSRTESAKLQTRHLNHEVAESRRTLSLNQQKINELIDENSSHRNKLEEARREMKEIGQQASKDRLFREQRMSSLEKQNGILSRQNRSLISSLAEEQEISTHFKLSLEKSAVQSESLLRQINQLTEDRDLLLQDTVENSISFFTSLVHEILYTQSSSYDNETSFIMYNEEEFEKLYLENTLLKDRLLSLNNAVTVLSQKDALTATAKMEMRKRYISQMDLRQKSLLNMFKQLFGIYQIKHTSELSVLHRNVTLYKEFHEQEMHAVHKNLDNVEQEYLRRVEVLESSLMMPEQQAYTALLSYVDEERKKMDGRLQIQADEYRNKLNECIAETDHWRHTVSELEAKITAMEQPKQNEQLQPPDISVYASMKKFHLGMNEQLKTAYKTVKKKLNLRLQNMEKECDLAIQQMHEEFQQQTARQVVDFELQITDRQVAFKNTMSMSQKSLVQKYEGMLNKYKTAVQSLTRKCQELHASKQNEARDLRECLEQKHEENTALEEDMKAIDEKYRAIQNTENAVLLKKIAYLEQSQRAQRSVYSETLSLETLKLKNLKEIYAAKLIGIDVQRDMEVTQIVADTMGKTGDHKTANIIKKIMAKTARVAKLYEEERLRCEAIRQKQLTEHEEFASRADSIIAAAVEAAVLKEKSKNNRSYMSDALDAATRSVARLEIKCDKLLHFECFCVPVSGCSFEA